MQSCSIHHCVLFFLTLTFTTAPVSAAVCPTTVKGWLHQPVTLPCENDCSGVAKWALDRTRDVVFARCNKTSCSSLKEGYEMSHDQYLKGDLSLTITAADYSKRNTYSCECGINDISTVRLRIETVFSAVQMKPGEDLILDLSVPEPVEVIYRSRDSAAGEQICTVTQRSLQCKAEYTHRTSLSHPELTLRDVGWSDSGSYTIRDLKTNEDIRVYTVSVTGLTKGGIAAVVLAVLLLVVGLLIAAVILYRRKAAEERRAAAALRAAEEERRAAEEERRELMSQVEEMYVNIESEDQTEKEEKVKNVKKAINDLEQRYTENSKYSDYVGLLCDRKRAELKLCKTVYTTKPNGELEPEPEQVMMLMDEVVKSLEFLKYETYKQKSSIPTELLTSVCGRVKSCLQKINIWCSDRREKLNKLKQLRGGAGAKTVMNDMKRLLGVYGLWYEEKKNKLEKYREKLKLTESSKEDPAATGNREGGELTPLNFA